MPSAAARHPASLICTVPSALLLRGARMHGCTMRACIFPDCITGCKSPRENLKPLAGIFSGTEKCICIRWCHGRFGEKTGRKRFLHAELRAVRAICLSLWLHRSSAGGQRDSSHAVCDQLQPLPDHGLLSHKPVYCSPCPVSGACTDMALHGTQKACGKADLLFSPLTGAPS